MDRFIAYIGEMIPEWSFTAQGQYTMLALGKALQAVAGTSTFTVGLPCTPNSPAALNVLVGEGEIYMMESLEASVMGTLPADTSHQVLKQGMLRNTTTLSCPAPSTAGQSINYLIQATYQDSDVSLDPTTGNTNVVMPFFSGSVGQTPYSGPNNSGQTSNTFRQGVCNVTVKAGAAATTGTQATPAPDSGYVGLYVVTVANGQATITSGNISPYSGAPAGLPTLSQIPAAVQNKSWSYNADVGSANAYAVTLSPAPSAYAAGQEFTFKAANSSTGASTLNVGALGSALGARSIVRPDGSALAAGDIIAGQMVTVRYDGANFQLVGRALGNYLSAQRSSAATVNLTASQAGTPFYLTLSTSQTVNLPALAALAPGASFILSTFSGGATVNASGADLIDPRTGTVGSITLKPFEDVVLVADAAGFWNVVSGSFILRQAASQPTSPFGASYGAGSWYTRSPSGLILQGGSGTTSGSGSSTVTFPLTFPTAIRSIVATNTSSGAQAFINATSPATSGFQIAAVNTSGGYVAENFNWIAAGN